jgi:predicted GTPase
MGDRVPGLKLSLPVFKTRLKDSCCKLSAQAGWRVYYAVSIKTSKVYMVFFHHKKEIENPGLRFLQQKIQKTFEQGE